MRNDALLTPHPLFLALGGSVVERQAAYRALFEAHFDEKTLDEALSGEWKDHRSSRLGLQWRVIYQVVANVLLIQVVQVTAHDYRRP